MMHKLRFDIRPGFCIIVALSLLLIPAGWILAWAIAILIHESGHYLTAKLLRCSVSEICLDASGIRMHMSPMSPSEELICALAGPVFAAILLLFFGVYPQLAICGLVQSCFNLLPIFPMDGGRILKSTLELFRMGELVPVVNRWLTWLILIGLAFFLCYISWKIRSFFLPLMILPLALKGNIINLPCKHWTKRVQ